MRFERLHIDGFGIHRDLVLEFGPGLNVLLGPNEAGKSTIHAFVRAMLHGPRRGEPNHLPLAGGAHGGSLTLAEGATSLRLERTFSGKKRLRVLDPEGVDLGESALRSHLGNVDAALYRSVFAFDLDDLRELGLESDEIERRLFDAGLLGAGRSIVSLRKELREAKEALLRARSGPIRELAREIGELRRELGERVGQSRAHGEWIREEEELARELRSLLEERSRLRVEERRWSLLLTLWPDEAERQRWSRRLESLPPAGEGAAALEERLSRVRRLEERIATLAERLEHLGAEREAILRERENLEIDDRLLALGPDLSSLLRGASFLEETLERIAALERSVLARSEQARALLSGLGPGWCVERALALDRSLERRERLDALAQRLSEAARDLEAAERRAVETQEALTRSTREVELARESLAALGQVPTAEELDRRAGALAEVRAALWRRAAPRHERRAGTSRALAALALLGALLCLALGEWVGAAVAAFSGVALLALGGRPGRAPREEGVEAYAAILGLRDSDRPAEVEAVAAQLERERVLRQRWEELSRRLADRRERERIDREVHEAALERVEEAHGRLARELEAWTAHCRDLGENLGPEAAKERLARLERAVEAWEAGMREGEERAALQARVDAWVRRARDFLTAAGEEIPSGGPGDLLPRLAVLERRVGEEEERSNRLRESAERLARLEREIERDSKAIEAARAEWTLCLREAGVEAVDALVGRLERQRERERAEQALARIESSLLQRIGQGEEAERIRVDLATGRREEWELGLERARESIEEIEGRIESVQAALVRLQQRREDLEASTAIPELSERLRRREAEWGEKIQRYRKAALLEKLLDAALEDLHEARQPAVLRSASASFERITGGRYVRIRQMREQRHVEVVLPHGGAVAASSLSRGTREQLYLCLRLGLADAFAEQGIRLPLLMDDVLVNFDPERALATAEVLAEAATRHQILVFTCHPTTARLLEEVAGAVRLEFGASGEVLREAG